jgi:CcmD family protein
MRNRLRPFLAGVVTIAVLLMMSGSLGLAFQDSGFVPVKPGEAGQETLPAAPLVFTAYGLIWTMLLAYVFLLWRKLGRVERELADVNAKLRAGHRTP